MMKTSGCQHGVSGHKCGLADLHDRLNPKVGMKSADRHNLIPIQGNTDITQTSRKNRFSFSRSFCVCQLLRVIEVVKQGFWKRGLFSAWPHVLEI